MTCAPDAPPPVIVSAWASRAAELAEWAGARFVNRTDVFGGYLPLDKRGKRINAQGVEENWEGPYTRPAKRSRGKVILTRPTIARHFAARRPEDVIGTHTTSEKNTSVYGAVEVDWHGPEGTTPEINWKAALGWHQELTRMGFRPLLTDSNGRGGYHLRILLAEAILTPRLFWFLRWLIRDHEQRGMSAAPETFPKQSTVQPGKFGNWLRLVGRHHTREHWSRVWGGASWLEGNDAIDFMLGLTGDPGSLIPEDAEWRYRIGEYMAKLPNLGEGQHRDDVAYNFLAFMVRDLQQPDEYALEWANRWDAGNRPPKGPERLREILGNVHEYGQHSYGAGLNGTTGRPKTAGPAPPRSRCKWAAPRRTATDKGCRPLDGQGQCHPVGERTRPRSAARPPMAQVVVLGRRTLARGRGRRREPPGEADDSRHVPRRGQGSSGDPEATGGDGQ